MANGLNKVMLIGNLGQDPELRHTQGGKAVLSLRIATTESWKDQSGELKEKTEWSTANLWGPRAEALAKILSKGERVYVEGSLQTRSWEKDGTKHYSTEINVKEVILLGSRSGQKPSQDSPRPSDDDIPF